MHKMFCKQLKINMLLYDTVTFIHENIYVYIIYIIKEMLSCYNCDEV